MSELGGLLIAAGAMLLLLSRVLDRIARKSADEKILNKEAEANEANKNSVAKLLNYRELKRKYDELRNRK